VGELEVFLRDPDTHSAFVRISGEVSPGWVLWLSPGSAFLVAMSYFYAGEFELLHREFWRDTAHLEVVPDVNGIDDRLEVRRPQYVNGGGPYSFLPGGTFLVRRTDAERWEVALPPAPSKPTPFEKYKRYTTDDDLVVEGVNGIRSGAWPNPLQAAQVLAPHAEGSSHDSIVDRLRKKIGAALEG
jgi:hypothetical protein